MPDSIRPSKSPNNKSIETVPQKRAIPSHADRVNAFVNTSSVFSKKDTPPQSPVFKASIEVPQSRFLGLADLLEIDHSEEMMGFLKEYTDKEFIDEINAFKHLPIIDHAIKQITLSFKKWDVKEDRLKLEETLTNQFKNLEMLIDILTDILPLAGEKVSQLQESSELRKYLSGEEAIEGEIPFKIRDHFLLQLHQKKEPK